MRIQNRPGVRIGTMGSPVTARASGSRRDRDAGGELEAATGGEREAATRGE